MKHVIAFYMSKNNCTSSSTSHRQAKTKTPLTEAFHNNFLFPFCLFKNLWKVFIIFVRLHTKTHHHVHLHALKISIFSLRFFLCSPTEASCDYFVDLLQFSLEFFSFFLACACALCCAFCLLVMFGAFSMAQIVFHALQ